MPFMPVHIKGLFKKKINEKKNKNLMLYLNERILMLLLLKISDRWGVKVIVITCYKEMTCG